uniref:Uncharacterized protein n=1 Tax=Salix viminalis TaxID=40686 RepID=A0A6N2LCQ4_SALVM
MNSNWHESHLISVNGTGISFAITVFYEKETIHGIISTLTGKEWFSPVKVIFYGHLILLHQYCLAAYSFIQSIT